MKNLNFYCEFILACIRKAITVRKERNILINTAPQGCLIQVILLEAAYTQAKCMLIESRSILTHSLLKEGIIFSGS